MNKEFKFNLSLHLKDTEKVIRELEAVGRKLKPIKIRFEIDDRIFKDGKIKLDFDCKQSGERFGAVASEKMSESIRTTLSQNSLRISTVDSARISREISTAISKSIQTSFDEAFKKSRRGNILGALGSLAAAPIVAPFKAATSLAGYGLSLPAKALNTVARGILDGLTQELVSGVGRGLSQGLESSLGKKFGSQELLGKVLFAQLENIVPNATSTALQKLKEKFKVFDFGQGFGDFFSEKIGSALRAELQKIQTRFVEQFDEKDIIGERYAVQRKVRQQRASTEEDAAKEVNLQRQQVARQANVFKEELPSKLADIEARRQDIQAREDKELRTIQEKNTAIQALLDKRNERLSELAQKRDQLYVQIYETPKDEQAKLKALEQELEKVSSEELTNNRSIQEIEQTKEAFNEKIKSIEAKYKNERAFLEIEEDSINELAIQHAKNIKLVERRLKLVGTPEQQQDLLKADTQKLEEDQRLNAEKLEQKNKQRLELLQLVQNIENAETARLERELERQQKIVRLRDKFQQASKTPGKGKAETLLAIGKEYDAIKNPEPLDEKAIQATTKVYALLEEVSNTLVVLNQQKKEIEKRAEELGRRAGNTPTALPTVIRQLYQNLLGEIPEGDETPAIVEASSQTLAQNSLAAYKPYQNVLAFRKDTFDAIQNAKSLDDLSIEQIKQINEEILHSYQEMYGEHKLLANDFLQNYRRVAADATPEERAALGPELAYYPSAEISIEQDAKVARDRALAKEKARRESNELLSTISEDVGIGGTKYIPEVNKALKEPRELIQAIEREAAQLGDAAIDASGIEKVKAAFNSILKLSEDVGGRLAQTVADQPSPDVARALVKDVKRTIDQIDALYEVIELAEQRLQQFKTAPQSSALTRTGEVASGIADRIEPAGNIILHSAEMAGNALGVVAKAGLALADKLGFAGASLFPGGALLYEPILKPAAKTAAVGGALAAGSATIPGLSEILGAITSTITTVLSPATSGLATAVGADVAAQITGALPQLFNALSGTIAGSGLPGAQLTAEVVNTLGGQLTHVLQPVVQGVASTADAGIVAVGNAVNQFLGELGTILLAGKGVETGVKLATDKDAREAALQGIQTVGEGVGQFVNAVPEAIETVQEVVSRTSQAVSQNIEEIKGAGQRVAQGEVAAVGDVVEAGVQAAANIARGTSDVAKASTKAAQDIVEGAAKVGGVFGKLASQNIPGIEDLGELTKGQLLNVYEQLTKKLENALNAEIEAIQKSGSAGTGRSGVIRGDLDRIANVLQQKYQHTIDVVAEEIRDEPLAIPAKINLPELQPVPVEGLPQQEPLKLHLDTPAEVTQKVSPQNIEVEEPRVDIDIPTIDIKAEQIDDGLFNQAIREVDAEFSSSREEIQKLRNQVSSYVDAAIAARKAIKKATQKGDVVKAEEAERAFRDATDEANRYGLQLTTRAREIYVEIQNSRKLLQDYGVDTSQESELGRALDGYKQTLTKSINSVESRLRKIGIDLNAESLGGDALNSISPGFDEITRVLREKAQSLSSALQNLIETAKNNPQLVNTAKDLAVNTAGFVASQAVSDHGAVAQLAADLVAALAARNAIALSSGGEDGDRGLIEAIRRLTARLDDPKFQEGIGREIFGDILGFVTGNLTNQITGIPGSGAAAASLIVPRVQKARDSIVDTQSSAKDPEIEAALEDLKLLAEKAKAIDPSVGDRIALFLLSVKKALNLGPTPQEATELQKAAGDTVKALKALEQGVKADFSPEGFAGENDLAKQIDRLQKLASEEEEALRRFEDLNFDPRMAVTNTLAREVESRKLRLAELREEIAALREVPPEVVPEVQAQTLNERLAYLAKLAEAEKLFAQDKLTKAKLEGEEERRQEQETHNQRIVDIDREQNAKSDAFVEELRQKREVELFDRRLADIAQRSKKDDLGDRLAQIQQDTQPNRLEQIHQERQATQESLEDRLVGLQRLSQQEQEVHSQRIANAARERELESEAFSENLRNLTAIGNAERDLRQKKQEVQTRASKEERDEFNQRLADAANQAQQVEDLTTKLSRIEPEEGLTERLSVIAKEQRARKEAVNERILDAKRAGEEETRTTPLTRVPKPQTEFYESLVPKITVDITAEQRSQAAREAQERKETERIIANRLRKGVGSSQPLEESIRQGEEATARFTQSNLKFNLELDRLNDKIDNQGKSAQGIFSRVGQAYRRMVERVQADGGDGGGPGGPNGFFAAMSAGADKAKASLAGIAEKIGVPIGAFTKLGQIAKYTLVGLLAYAGISTIGDALVQLGRQAFETSTQFERLKNRISFTNNNDIQKTKRDIDFVTAEAARIKKPVNEILEAYAQIRIASKNTQLEGFTTDEVFKSLGTLSRVLDLTADNVQAVQTQIGQAFRVGRADTEDLKTLADRNIPIWQKLSQVMGVSIGEIQKKVEAGEVTAKKLAEAFILAGKEAEGSLAQSLKTPGAALDDLKRSTEATFLAFGQFISPAVVAGLGVLQQTIGYLAEAGKKLAPIFRATYEVFNLISVALSPIRDFVSNIVSSGLMDFLDGLVFPFQLIADGTRVLSQELQKIYQFFAPVTNAIGDFIQKTGVLQAVMRGLGLVVGTLLIGSFIRLAVVIGGTVVTAFGSLAGVITTTVIPAIGRLLLAARAFIFTPIGATITAIAVLAAAAIPHIEGMAKAFSGLQDIKGQETLIEFNKQYSIALGKLQSGVPLAAEELKKLKDQFAENARTGRESAKVVQALTANLDKLQAKALAVEPAQKALSKAFKDSADAFELAQKGVDSRKFDAEIQRNRTILDSQLSLKDAKEVALQEEIEDERQYSQDLISVYEERNEELASLLAQHEALLASGGLDDKQKEERKNAVEAAKKQQLENTEKLKKAQLDIAKSQVKEQEELEKQRVQQVENSQKIIENQIAAGTKNRLNGEIEISNIKQREGNKRIAEIDLALEKEIELNNASSELAKQLYSERAVLVSEYARLEAEENQKIIEEQGKVIDVIRNRITTAISQSEQESLKITQDLVNQGVLTQVQADQERQNSTKERLQREYKLELANLQALQLINKSTDPHQREEQEQAIRAARLKTAELATQLAQQEQADQEALTKVIQERLDREQKGLENLATRQNQAYERQLTLLEKLNGALEIQNKLIESRKELQGAIGGYLQTEYKILIDTAKSDEEKQRLTRKSAEAELLFLVQRQRFDRESLEVKLLIKAAEQERLRLQNQAEQLSAKSAIAQAQSELAKAQADPKALPEQLEALQLAVNAAVSRLDAERGKGELLGAQGVLNERESLVARRSLRYQQAGEFDQKRFEYGKTLPEDRQEAYFNRLRKEVFDRFKDTDFDPRAKGLTSKELESFFKRGREAIAGSNKRKNLERPGRDEAPYFRTGPYTPTTYGIYGNIDPKTGIPEQRSLPKVGVVTAPTLKQVDPSTSTEFMAQLQASQTNYLQDIKQTFPQVITRIDTLVGINRELVEHIAEGLTKSNRPIVIQQSSPSRPSRSQILKGSKG